MSATHDPPSAGARPIEPASDTGPATPRPPRADRDAPRGAPASRLARWCPALLLAWLMLVHALPHAWGLVLNDTARDIAHALQIVHGGELPLRGPIINAMLHVGPVWYYLLAALLAVSGSIAGTYTLVGVLGATKFPLAYACGARLGGRTLALAFAVALALPGWGNVQQFLVGHWNLAEATTLACAYALIRLGQGGGRGWWLAYGLLQGLAMHAHPSTVIVAVALPWVVWLRRATWRRDLAAIAAGALLSLLWFLPSLVAEARDGWPAAERVGSYLQERSVGGWLAGLGRVVDGSLRGSIELVAVHLAGDDAELAIAGLFVLVHLVAITGLALALRDARRRRAVLRAALLCLAGLVALRALRDTTPFYMLLAWLPMFALLLALGLDAVRRQGGLARRFALAAFVAVFLLQATTTALWIRRAEQGVIAIPIAAIADVARPQVPERVALLPARQLDRLGRLSCAAAGEVVVHGQLAILVDTALSAGSRAICAARGDPGIGGGATRPAARHLLGLVPATLARIGHDPAGWDDTLALEPHRVIAGERSLAVPAGSDYPLRSHDTGDRRVHTLRFAAEPEDRVVITHPTLFYDGAVTRRVEAAGRATRTLASTPGTSIHACEDCAGASVAWEIDVETGYPERIDIVLARPGAPRAGQTPRAGR